MISSRCLLPMVITHRALFTYSVSPVPSILFFSHFRQPSCYVIGPTQISPPCGTCVDTDVPSATVSAQRAHLHRAI